MVDIKYITCIMFGGIFFNADGVGELLKFIFHSHKSFKKKLKLEVTYKQCLLCFGMRLSKKSEIFLTFIYYKI